MANVDCICPPLAGETRHPEGDTVTLRPVLDFRTAATIQHAVSVLRLEDQEPAVEEVLARLTEAYVKFGVESWTCTHEVEVEEHGRKVTRTVPIPVNPHTVEEVLFPNIAAAMVVGEEADEMYSGTILLPLLKRASNSSPATPTPDETSAPTSSPPNTPTPLRQSLTITTPTDDIEPTSDSPAGVSSSSPSLASAS